MPEGPPCCGTVAADRLVAPERGSFTGHTPRNREVAPMKVAVVKESAPGERRVALVPETIARLRQAGLEVLVESGAGDGAWFPDNVYIEADASIVSHDDLYSLADIILTVTRPGPGQLARLRDGQAIIGMLSPLTDPALA